MSSIVNKVKDALHSDSKHEAPEGTSGPYGSRVANTADPRVDSDRDHRANPTTHTGGYSGNDNYAYGSGTGATGTGAGIGNSRTTGYNDPEGTHGPHSSRLANAADPRVDSDRDNRGTHGTTGGAFGTTGAGAGYGGSKTTGYNDPEGTHGPHSSRLANAADPRVDSDRDNRGTHGTHGTTGAGITGAGAGYGGSHTTGYNDPEGTHGPHSSRVANAADPRVDSDRDNRGTGGYGNTAGGGAFGTTGTGAGYGSSKTTGYNDPEGTHGPHSSRVGNAADPRVDSDRDHRGVHNGPGPAPNTAGPHKSDMANKVDPRVDSDLDGSKTLGGNRTYQSGSNYNKDPTDAAQVPPSVLRQAVGGPTIEHDAHDHDRAGRHQSASHQETHRGL